MTGFLEWTAWPMDKPPVYGAFHLIFAVIGIAAAIAGAWLLRKVSTKQLDRIVLSAGIVLAAAEIYKQLFYFYVLYDASYYWWIFPFQLCSIPIYLCLVAPLLREGKVKNTFYNFLGSFTLMSGIIVFVSPSGMLFEYWTLTLHSFIWHFLLVFLGFLLGFSGKTGVEKNGFLRATVFYVVLCAIALAINFVVLERTGGNINMFYLGPIHTTQPVFETISQNYGWYVNLPIYMACTIFAAFLAYLPFKLRNQAAQKTQKSALHNNDSPKVK